MTMVKIDYFSLLSPLPLPTPIGSIKSPTLLDVSRIGYQTYQSYLNLLLMNISSYYSFIDKYEESYFYNYTNSQKELVIQVKREYENFTDDQKINVTFFDIFIFDVLFCQQLVEALNFFFQEDVEYDFNARIFNIYRRENNEKTLIGFINSSNYDDITDIILQRVNVQKSISEENVKVKNKLAAKFLEKIKKGEEKKNKKEDKKTELGNIISSLSSHSKSLNIVNIWDLTVYQLYDQFRKQQHDDMYKINSINVSVWGNKDGKFDNSQWFSLLNEE